jgi:hypothetical protein
MESQQSIDSAKEFFDSLTLGSITSLGELPFQIHLKFRKKI